MHRRRMARLLVAAVTLSACTGGSEPDRDDASSSSSDAPAGTERIDDDGTDQQPVNSGAPTATIAGQPVDDQPVDDQPAEAGDPDDDLPPPDPASTIPGLTIDPPPADQLTRVISLSPTHTETIFAIGAETILVAVDPGSDHPAAAVALQNGDLRPSTGDTAVIAALDPDLVIVDDDPTDLASRLGALGIATWRGATPTTVDAAFGQIEALGAVLGRGDAAAALVAEMRGELTALRDTLPVDGTLTYFHENDPGFITPAPDSFIDLVYAELGLLSIIDEGGVDGAGGPAAFIQSSADAVVAGDPAVLVLADITCCAVDAAVAAGRPGWDAIAAVRTGAIAEVPDVLPQRWGPRLVEWWRLVAEAATVAAAAADRG